MLDRNVSDSALSRQTGLARETISRVARGENSPSLVTRRAIAQALCLTVEDIAFRADEREYKPQFPIRFTIYEEGYFRRHEPELMAEVDRLRAAWTPEIEEKWRIHIADLARNGVAITAMRTHLVHWMAEQAGTEPANPEGTTVVRPCGPRVASR